MLDTLYKFGRQLSQNTDREEFDDCIAPPPLDDKVKDIQFYVAQIIIDLDTNTFRLDEHLKPFSEGDKSFKLSQYHLRCIKIQGGNNKSIYPTVDPRKSFEPWRKTFFGKEDKNGNPPKKSELVEAIQKDFPDLIDSILYKAAEQIFSMRDAFEVAYPEWKKVSEGLKMDSNNRVAMLYASIISDELGIREPVPVAQLEGYDALLRRKFLKKGANPNEERKNAVPPKLCYVTGVMHDNVGEPVFDNRYSLNKMFVTTTKNYATGFDDKDFSKNYQASNEAQLFLERGSSHFLKNYKVSIAGIDHCIIPQFRINQDVDVDYLTSRLKKKSELLFLMTEKQVGGLLADLDSIAEDDIYWINFLGYESDGNFFKTINQITDISKTYFETVIKVLNKIDSEMSDTEGVEWHKVMAFGRDQTPLSFNFNTLFSLIPVRKEKRNEALTLFKSILEHHSILGEKIFSHFVELIQCHRYERYSGYNITPNSNFDFACRNTVFQYHAFFQFLKKINLLTMEEKSPTSDATFEEKNSAISAFFERMGYTDDQRAVFYLGKTLNSVGRAQWEKGHKTKPVLSKVNYNGMDAASLKRLHADLFEKCKQYDILSYNEGNFSKFTDLFKDSEKDKWDKRMKPDESLFYLLSGYSFRTSKETNDDPESSKTTSEN